MLAGNKRRYFIWSTGLFDVELCVIKYESMEEEEEEGEEGWVWVGEGGSDNYEKLIHNYNVVDYFPYDH